jgi:hypothetical protein
MESECLPQIGHMPVLLTESRMIETSLNVSTFNGWLNPGRNGS